MQGVETEIQSQLWGHLRSKSGGGVGDTAGHREAATAAAPATAGVRILVFWMGGSSVDLERFAFVVMSNHRDREIHLEDTHIFPANFSRCG